MYIHICTYIWELPIIIRAPCKASCGKMVFSAGCNKDVRGLGGEGGRRRSTADSMVQVMKHRYILGCLAKRPKVLFYVKGALQGARNAYCGVTCNPSSY